LAGTAGLAFLALVDFGRRSGDADITVLFYAGHGMEVAGAKPRRLRRNECVRRVVA